MADLQTAEAEDWRRVAPGRRRLRASLRAIGPHAWITGATVWLLLAGTAGFYVLSSNRDYEGQAQLLVAPLPPDEGPFALGLVTESAEPAIEVQTAAGLVRRQAVAQAAADELGDGATAASVLDEVVVAPLGKSSVVGITASDPNATRAADVANAFARAALELRGREVRNRIDQELVRLQTQAGRTADRETAAQLAEQIVRLEHLRDSGETTLSLLKPAERPDSPSGAPPALALAVGLVGGLVVSMIVVLGVRLTDGRLRHERQLLRWYRLPVLARIPGGRRESDPLASWDRISTGAKYGFRTLRSTLASQSSEGRFGASVVLITGVAPATDRAGVSLQLASSLALAGHEVVLIEVDPGNPLIWDAIGSALEHDAGPGPDATTPGFQLVTSRRGTARLRFLRPTGPVRASPAIAMADTMREVLAGVGMTADFVIIDAPSPTEALDTLPLTRIVDSLVIVVRLGASRLRGIRELTDALAVGGLRPAGFVITGSTKSTDVRRERRSRGADPSAGLRTPQAAARPSP